MNFHEAFEILLGHEGELSDHPKDRGGLTKFGISQRAYPDEDIVNLTVERAKELYLRDYWKPAGCEHVPEGIRFDLFDMAVNSGLLAATRTLQRACGVSADGKLGPLTLKAIEGMDHVRLVAKFNGYRLAYLATLRSWPSFGRGWAGRIATNLARL